MTLQYYRPYHTITTYGVNELRYRAWKQDEPPASKEERKQIVLTMREADFLLCPEVVVTLREDMEKLYTMYNTHQNK